MYKILKILGLIIGIFILIIIIMAVFKICPPAGPWPTPPWCTIKKVDTEFNYSSLPYIQNNNSKTLKNNFVFGIGMMDLWGKLCTSPFTCDNPKEDIEPSFERLKQLNTDLVMVTDFYQIDRDLNFLSVNGGGARTISLEDMKLLLDKAHANNMKFMLMTNLYEKDNSREILDQENPTNEYIDMLFNKWQEKILDQAQKGNYDYFVINPRDIGFFFNNKEDNDYINKKLIELIPEVRKYYSGDICLWGPKNWVNDFGNAYDCVIIDEEINSILNNASENIDSITTKWNNYLDEINYNKPTFILILMPSYKGALDKGWIEPVGEKYGDEYESDYKIQALVYEGFFRAVANHPNINGIISYGYWWNDRIYPNTLDIFRNDLSHSIRDKDAESVFYKWANNLH